MQVRALGFSVGCLVAIGLVAGCADDDATLCASYANYLVLADAAYAADPTAATAADVAESVDAVRANVAQMRALADGRYRSPIDELAGLLGDLENTLASVPDDADYAVWAPLVDDTLDDVRIADQRLRRVVSPACAAVIVDENA